MSLLPFPADSAEFEEYTSVMNAMADEANASVPDPEPDDWSPYEQYDELRAREDSDFYASLYERENDYDDGDPYGRDDQISEHGMEGCCGNFWTLTAHSLEWASFWLESNNLTKNLTAPVCC